MAVEIYRLPKKGVDIVANRKTITKKIRFEIFKRDSFTCQYCGETAPNVLLEVDHIEPVSKGGTNEIINLITSCRDCNRGKGKTKLSENAVVNKQIEQLRIINERREQLKLMVEWKSELDSIVDDELGHIKDLFNKKTGFLFSRKTNIDVKKLISKYGFNKVYDALEISIYQYFDIDFKEESAIEVIEKLFGILKNRENPEKNEYMKEIYYIVGIMKNRCFLYDKCKSITRLKQAYNIGVDLDEVKNIAKTCRNWSEFWYEVNDLISCKMR